MQAGLASTTSTSANDDAAAVSYTHLDVYKRQGFILDGYPRNLVQAAALDALLADLGQKFDAAVQLVVDNEQIIERLAGRAKAEGRSDDTPESVRHRLNVYDEKTAPVVDFYRQHGQLTVVNGVGALDEVFTRIVEALQRGHAVG